MKKINVISLTMKDAEVLFTSSQKNVASHILVQVMSQVHTII